MATEAAAATARLLRQRLGREVWLRVDGDSMRPTIEPPAEVRVVARDRPRVGEVWAFVGAGGRVVVHRCERRTPAGYVFHGDGRVAADPITAPDLLIGRAVAVRDQRGERPLRAFDRLRGSGCHMVRRAGRFLRRGRRWAGSLISHGARSG
jgi:hypothetical protein